VWVNVVEFPFNTDTRKSMLIMHNRDSLPVMFNMYTQDEVNAIVDTQQYILSSGSVGESLISFVG
jgi:hypothetical protein